MGFLGLLEAFSRFVLTAAHCPCNGGFCTRIIGSPVSKEPLRIKVGQKIVGKMVAEYKHDFRTSTWTTLVNMWSPSLEPQQ